jgi:hypothetical protein
MVAFDCSADGSVIVGEDRFSLAAVVNGMGVGGWQTTARAVTASGGHVVGARDFRPVRWRTPFLEETVLPLPAPFGRGIASDVTADASTVVIDAWTEGATTQYATLLWRAGIGTITLTSHLERRGVVVPSGARAFFDVRLSDDGRVFAGNMTSADFTGVRVFVASLPCRADFNSDGELTFDDVASFAAQYNAQTLRADLNEDNEWTFEDVQLFIAAFNAQEC